MTAQLNHPTLLCATLAMLSFPIAIAAADETARTSQADPSGGASRVFVESRGFRPDANIEPRHPADAASWIWHPAFPPGKTAFLRFSLEFDLAAQASVPVHVTADQRFQLYLDDREIGFGPDRSDIENWSVASYTLQIGPGRHRIEALVWWIADGTLTGLRADPAIAGSTEHVRPPIAQATWRGGFLLASDEAHAAQLNSGRARWLVEDLNAAIRPVPKKFYAYHDIGPEFHIDGAAWKYPTTAVRAETIISGIRGNPHGVQRPGWQLSPATLPEQTRRPVGLGRVRIVEDKWTDGPFAERMPDNDEAKKWSAVFATGSDIVIPPHSARTIVWDFEDYVCGYVSLVTSSGAGARVRIDWAEAFHEAANTDAVTANTPKGRRDAISGKVFFGFGDEFLPTDGVITFPALWWRSGRFLRICIRTDEQPLRIAKLTVRSTGYPLGAAAKFVSDNAPLNSVLTLAERTLRANGHEVWTDCPYYEQMAYVGDNRLTALSNYAVFADDRLSRRMIELFDGSRRANGLVAERVPSSWQQVSPTYSLLWVLMVRDYAWWRDDVPFVRARLRGVRAMLDEVMSFCGEDGLLGRLPGWPFVDWASGWRNGCGPGVREGDSSIVNLHLLLALRAAGQLEELCGEPELASLDRRHAENLSRAIVKRYWSSERNLLADTRALSTFSEHAQALGVLAEIKPPTDRARWLDAWHVSTDLTPATIYFTFYTMEALRQTGRTEDWHSRMEIWKQALPTGLLTLPEAPEPTRSDCHGWSAHLRWHAAASIAGVRPLAAGFARVEIAPQLGALNEISTEIRHPKGTIRLDLHRDGQRVTGVVDLPPSITGEFHWHDKRLLLRPERNVIDLP